MMKKRLTKRVVRYDCRAFTLAEMLISVAVMVLLILLVTQVINIAATTVSHANKHIDTDTEARMVFDKMAADFRQMLKRTDVDYYVKGPVNYNGHGNGHAYGRRIQTGQQGSDQIAFFSQVWGYDPSQLQNSPCPLSLVAYRVNGSDGTNNSAAYLRLERMGKRLIWNSTPQNGNASNRPIPIFFLPLTITTMAPAAVSPTTYDTNAATYETIGPDVFRFEYYYLLKTGKITDVPFNTDSSAGPTYTSLAGIGLGGVQAIGVTIAVVDPASRALINAAGATSLFDLSSDLADFRTAPGRGVGNAQTFSDLEYSWTTTLIGDPTQTPPLPGIINTGLTSNNTPVPPAAAKAIRIYSRTFDLRIL
jgi:hypothetical protein